MNIKFILTLSLCMALPISALSKTRVMFSPLRAQGVEESLAKTLTDLVIFELSRAKVADIVSDNDLTAALDHQAKQNLLGCDENCMVNLAKQLECTHIVHGSIGKLGPSMVLNVTILDISDSSVLGRQSQVLQGSGEQWLPAIQLTANQILQTLTGPAPGGETKNQELIASLESLRIAQRPKRWNLTLSTGIGYMFSGLEGAGLTKPLFMGQLSFDYSLENWFLLGFETTFVLNQGQTQSADNLTNIDVLLRGYYGSIRAILRKSTGLWMPYGGMSLGFGYIKISDDRDGSGNNTSVLGGSRTGRGNAGFLFRGFTGSQFMISNDFLIDVQLMIFQHINSQSFEVTDPESDTEPLYQGSWDKIRGAVLFIGVSWQS